MKRQVLFLTLLLKAFICLSQTTYYDAKDICDHLISKNGANFAFKTDTASVRQLSAYLRNYLPENVRNNGTLTEDQIFAQFGENPFIGAEITTLRAGGFAPTIASFITKAASSSLGGLDVTKYVNAIADIMIERAKQELTIAFFNRFQKFAKDNPEFQILFPKTTDNLINLLTFSYPQMLPALRNSFFEDLKQITYRLDDVLELPRYRHLLNNFPEVRIAIRSIRLVQDLEDGTSTAADIIKRFAEFNEWNEDGSNTFKNMGGTIHLAAIFSESLRYKDNTRIWIPAKEAKELIRDDVFIKIYMGLVYQQIKNKAIKFYRGSPATSRDLTDIIKEQKDNIILFQNKLSEFLNLSDKVHEAYNEVKTKQNADKKITNEEVYNYINLSIEIAEYSLDVAKILVPNLVTDQYLTIVKKSNSLYKDIYTEDYTQAVNDAVDILKSVHDLIKESRKDTSIAKPDYAMSKGKGLEVLIDFADKVKPYALFMANMVEAKDESEVKAALENVILPVGSSSIKKYTRHNLSVQTYLGAFYTPNPASNGINGTWSDKFGVTAPIGISWTPGFTSWGKGGSLSLFTSLFDIGAIVDYKLKKEPNPTAPASGDSVINKDYKIELGQIFSPGVYIVYGCGGNLPISLGFGSQYGPGLSKIKDGSDPIVGNPRWRWNLFLAVDLPFFTIANRPKKQ